MQIVALTVKHASEYRRFMLYAYEHAADAFTSTPQERAAQPDSWWIKRIADPDCVFQIKHTSDSTFKPATDSSPNQVRHSSTK